MPNIKYIKINAEDLDILCWAATQHALGQKSYVVAWVTTIVEKYLQFLKKATTDLLIKKIEEYPNKGLYCSQMNWDILLSKLRMHKELKMKEFQGPKMTKSPDLLSDGRLTPRKG